MKNFIIGKAISFVKKNSDYSDDKLAEIRYGLTSLYLFITKLIIISFIACLLGIMNEFLIFILIYNVIKKPSFGLHATKSWICLVSSSTIFISFPYFCTFIYIPVSLKCFLGIVGILLLFKNSPADTHKKPIVNKKRRDIYKFISTSLAICYVFLSISINNLFVSNCFITALLLQCFITAPSAYKMFNIPYDNYKVFLNEHPEFATN